MTGRRRATSGVSSLEVLIAAALGAILAIALATLLFTGRHEAMVSEDYMFAEALAQRHLAEGLAVPFDDLAGRCERDTLKIPIEGVPPDDRALARSRPEYARNLEGPASFRGSLQIRLLQPGLLLYEVAIEWPVRLGASAMRRYALVRLRCRKDLSLTTRFRIEPPKGSALDGRPDA
jgi:hypothetical protein